MLYVAIFFWRLSGKEGESFWLVSPAPRLPARSLAPWDPQLGRRFMANDKFTLPRLIIRPRFLFLLFLLLLLFTSADRWQQMRVTRRTYLARRLIRCVISLSSPTFGQWLGYLIFLSRFTGKQGVFFDWDVRNKTSRLCFSLLPENEESYRLL